MPLNLPGLVFPLFALPLALASCAAPAHRGACPAPSAGFALHRIEVGGRALPYVVYTPEGLDPTDRPPAILFLHGRGECGVDGWKQVAVSSIAQAVLRDPARWPFVIVLPQKPDPERAWEEYDDLVMAALETALIEGSVDRDRVYLSGLSQGGHGTWVVAGMHPGVFAAIAPICGYGDASPIAPKLDRMPVWCFHGEDDNVVPIAQSDAIVEALRVRRAQGGPEVRFTRYPGTGHNAWDAAYAETGLPAWFLSHVRD